MQVLGWIDLQQNNAKIPESAHHPDMPQSANAPIAPDTEAHLQLAAKPELHCLQGQLSLNSSLTDRDSGRSWHYVPELAGLYVDPVSHHAHKSAHTNLLGTIS
jgi:hypothetical protein